jgi:hypothetical protein
MRSSISASDGSCADRRRAARLLLAGCAVVALSADATARLALDRASKIQQRIVAEYRGAQRIGCEPRTAKTHILVVGNSLLDEGVQFDRVREELGEMRGGSWWSERRTSIGITASRRSSTAARDPTSWSSC